MAKRKFSGERLYKFIRFLVTVVSIFTLFFGFFGLLKRNDNNLMYLDNYNECFSKNNSIEICGFWLDAIREDEKLIFYYLIIGIMLPILFYGGTWLYKYLFPVHEEKRE